LRVERVDPVQDEQAGEERIGDSGSRAALSAEASPEAISITRASPRP